MCTGRRIAPPEWVDGGTAADEDDHTTALRDQLDAVEQCIDQCKSKVQLAKGCIKPAAAALVERLQTTLAQKSAAMEAQADELQAMKNDREQQDSIRRNLRRALLRANGELQDSRRALDRKELELQSINQQYLNLIASPGLTAVKTEARPQPRHSHAALSKRAQWDQASFTNGRYQLMNEWREAIVRRIGADARHRTVLQQIASSREREKVFCNACVLVILNEDDMQCTLDADATVRVVVGLVRVLMKGFVTWSTLMRGSPTDLAAFQLISEENRPPQHKRQRI